MNEANWSILWEHKSYTLQLKHILALKLIEELVIKDDTIKSIVDFGCGQGILLNELNTRYKDSSINICGADNNEYSRSMLNSLNIKYINFDLSCDILSEQIDIAILTDVLEHFYEPHKVIKNLSSAKYIIIVVPNFSCIFERYDVLFGKVPFEMRQARGGHCFWVNKYSMQDMINQTDYKIIQQLNLYPKKLDFLPFLKYYDNLFATSFGYILENTNNFKSNK